MESDDRYRDALQTCLARYDRIDVVAAAARAQAALRLAHRTRPDVAVVDAGLAGSVTGVELGLRLQRARPEMGMVLLATQRDPVCLAELLLEKRAGWSCLVKSPAIDGEILRRAVEGAAAGLLVLDPALGASLGLHRPRRASRELPRLTPRRREILDRMARGYSNGAIAEYLGISRKSVENQVNLLYQELGIGRSGELQPRVQAVLLYLGRQPGKD
ncbi:LuxR C-terminal-related transcriptional regulator [Limnochorda pilosa]|uniref:LuxR C-terminal-related transcriptional regulator n=1 Tax=Limnochorda pilosa TaxID=1555112 RepID=UPI00130EB030|nr:response regulator transcription factor [Limnochorda pilosa]